MTLTNAFAKFAAVASLAVAGLSLSNTAAADLSDLRGTWVNVNANTGGITKVIVGGSGNTATLKAWGACSPSDCAWGQVNAMPLTSSVGASPASADRIMARFEKSFKTSMLSAYRSGDKLIVENATNFKDNRADTYKVYKFKRLPILINPILPTPVLPMPILPVPTSLDMMEGTWKNVNSNTRGMTKLNIAVSGENVKVRAWGSCSPTDCNWGWKKGTPLTNSASGNPVDAKRVLAKWDTSFATKTAIIKRQGTNKLIVELTTIYKDGRSDRFNTYTFKK